MAFWGVEVKPWKPITYSCEKKATGRLRISQATLGIGSPVQKSVVQCQVGNRSPVLLCALLPNQIESCHLDLEFDESDDVVFSVLGPRGVYLTGYYVSKSHQPSPHSDSESFGVDIENSHTEESNCSGEDDEYEDSFIDDDEELQACTPSPMSSSKVGDETTPESSNLKKKKGHGKLLKKKRQVVESSDDANSHKSDDDDGFLSSIFKSKKGVKTDISSPEEITAQTTVEIGKKLNNYGEEKIDHVNINGNSERAKTGEKRKGRCEEDEETETFKDHIEKDHSVPSEDKKLEVDAPTNMGIGDSGLLPPESGSGNPKRSQKRRKGVQLEGTDEKYHNVGKDNKPDQYLSLDAVSKMNDMPAEKMDQEQQIDSSVCTKSALLVNDSQPEKKLKKKKKKQTQSEVGLGSGSTNTAANQENTLSKEKPVEKRTLSNGLIIEEIASGPPDGKVAAPGKKVKIYFTAMLKENGHVFYSNVGKDAFRFRLGNEENSDGWNFGIDGMHVGDKRRLTIPPSIRFGKHGATENIPPNSWLVYDVELAGVRK